MTYTNLPSGNYTFRVSASNGDGVWNENAIVFLLGFFHLGGLLPVYHLYVCMGIGMLACLYYRMNKSNVRN